MTKPIELTVDHSSIRFSFDGGNTFLQNVKEIYYSSENNQKEYVPTLQSPKYINRCELRITEEGKKIWREWMEEIQKPTHCQWHNQCTEKIAGRFNQGDYCLQHLRYLNILSVREFSTIDLVRYFTPSYWRLTRVKNPQEIGITHSVRSITKDGKTLIEKMPNE